MSRNDREMIRRNVAMGCERLLASVVLALVASLAAACSSGGDSRAGGRNSGSGGTTTNGGDSASSSNTGGGTGDVSSSDSATGGGSSVGIIIDSDAALNGGLPEASDAGCGGTSLQAELKPVDVLLVIDKSGSMLDTPAGATSDKWQQLGTALSAALDPSSLPSSISVGLELFPAASVQADCTADCCSIAADAATAVDVPIGPSATAVPQILDTLAATAPGGGTPTAAALARAFDYFTTGAGAALDGAKYVLLATDGGPDCNPNLTCDRQHCTTNLDKLCSSVTTNCCDPDVDGDPSGCLDDQATSDEVEKLAAQGIHTFVVGIPGTEVYSTYLDDFAVKGGEFNSMHPRYFAVDANGGASQLTQVLTSITGKLITSCVVELATMPPDQSMLNVVVDGTRIPKSGADGWDLDTQMTPWTVTLKGVTCQQIETEGARSVAIEYGCPTVN